MSGGILWSACLYSPDGPLREVAARTAAKAIDMQPLSRLFRFGSLFAGACRALLSLMLLAAAVAAQTTTQITPTLEGLMPGADGGGCSGNQWSSNLGAGEGELYSVLLSDGGLNLT